MHVLLTGATGWMGQHLARRLSMQGFHITAVGRSAKSFAPLAPPVWPEEIQCVVADLAEDLGELPTKVDAVVHIAGQSHATGMPTWLSVRDNVVASHHLFNYAVEAGAHCFVFASSLSVYGDIDAPVVDEATPCVNPGSYGLSKLLTERLLAEGASSLPILALRLPGVLGVGAYHPWVAGVLRQIVAGETVTIFNPDSPFNNTIHVDDLGDFIAGVLTRHPVRAGFDAVTLGAAGLISVREVPTIMAATIGITPSIRYIPAIRSSFTLSSKYAIDHYGYTPRHVVDVLRDFAYQQTLERLPT